MVFCRAPKCRKQYNRARRKEEFDRLVAAVEKAEQADPAQTLADYYQRLPDEAPEEWHGGRLVDIVS